LDYLTTHTSLSPIWHGFAHGFVNYKKECTRLAAASNKVHQLPAHGQWFSPGTPTSSTTKTGRHAIAEIMLKVALNTKNQSINQSVLCVVFCRPLFIFLSFFPFDNCIVCPSSMCGFFKLKLSDTISTAFT
jgi:hypothetical protein